MNHYSKRQFLKLLGLSTAYLPLAGCFDKKEKQQNTGSDTATGRPKESITGEPAYADITDEDVVMLERNHKAYAGFNQGYNKRLQFLPKYIAVCKTEKGVQYALHTARTEQLKVAVRSGGHSFEGFSSNNGGMAVNVSQMKKITRIDDEKWEIQPGCILQEIQDALFAEKRLLPAGSCGTVGIAGLTLGGGYGFFSRKYGFTCDNLLGLRMVKADSSIVSADHDEDLLWACKGGGNGNFGVVTSFVFRTYPMPAYFDSYVLKFRAMDAAKFEQTIHAWFEMTEKLPVEGFAAYVLNGKTLTVLVTDYGSGQDMPGMIAPLAAIAGSVQPVLKADLPKAMKRYYGRKGPINFKNASAGLYRNKEDILKIKDALFDGVIANPGIVFQINTLGGKIADTSAGQLSCYPHRQFPYLGELQAYWESSSMEAKLLQAFEDIQCVFADSGITAHYRNYPDINFKNWERSYYGDNYQKLQEIKSRYDKEELFQYPQSIKPI